METLRLRHSDRFGVYDIVCAWRGIRHGVQGQSMGRSLGLEGLVVYHAWRFSRTINTSDCDLAMAKMKVYISGPITGHDKEWAEQMNMEKI